LDGGRESITEWLTAPRAGLGMATRFDIAFYMYDRLVRAYRERFGAEQVLVLPYELLARDPLAYVDRVARFTGAPITASGREKVSAMPVANVSIGRPGTAIKRVLNAMIRSWLNPAGPLDSPDLNYYVGRAVLRLDRILAPGGRGSAAPSAIRERLSGCYEVSNRVLADLVGLDLAEYGYVC
jgi:hypothetical protein